MNTTGKRHTIPIPRTRDPLINTPLISLGPNGRGEEEFWISSFNHNAGAMGLRVTEYGAARRYDAATWRLPGFYSAVATGPHTLWLCCNLSQVSRLDLRSGRFTHFRTGAPGALAFKGMIYDAAAGQIFMAAFPPPAVCAFAFDINRKQTVRIWRDLACDRRMSLSFPNGDGSYSAVMSTPGLSLLQWRPGADELRVVPINQPAVDGKSSEHLHCPQIADAKGRRYFHGRGWYDPLKNSFVPPEPPPAREMAWFARHGDHAWGIQQGENFATVNRWHIPSGAVTPLATLPDINFENLNLTADGAAIVAVSMYGMFYRLNAMSGALEISRQMPTLSHGPLDCLCLDSAGTTLLGTPFISQRFWTHDLRTGKGADAGRAAPGKGEILRTWSIGRHIYMAAYTGGELMEFDPSQPARFPENPRVVADPPQGMRPVAGCDDGRHLFYSCSRPYGFAGSVLTRYDTVSGRALYCGDPLPHLQIQSLFLERNNTTLLAGATIHTDAMMVPPAAKNAALAMLDARTLQPRQVFTAPEGVVTTTIMGPLGPGRWLVSLKGVFAGSSPGQQEQRYIVWDTRRRQPPDFQTAQPLPYTGSCQYAGKAGLFLVYHDFTFTLWDMNLLKPVKRVLRDKLASHAFVIGDDLYVARTTHLHLLPRFRE